MDDDRDMCYTPACAQSMLKVSIHFNLKNRPRYRADFELTHFANPAANAPQAIYCLQVCNWRILTKNGGQIYL